MEEREIDKILKPKRKLIILFILFLSIAIVCIGLVFYERFTNIEEEPLNLSEIISNGSVEEGQYVEIESESLPILVMATSEKDNYLYFVKDMDENIYIVRLSNTTFKNIVEMIDGETGKINSTYQVKGVTSNIDEQIKNIALSNSYKVFKNNELNSDNFSQYLGKVYIEENMIDDRVVTLYTISVLLGVSFLILAIGYILPSILKVRKTFSNQELVDELRVELSNLTETPYKEQHLYLTKNYIVSGIQAIKYEDIIGAYISIETNYGIKVGKNLIVYTRDKKKHIVASVRPKNDVLDAILDDIHSKNDNIIVAYNDEDIEMIENFRK